MAHASPVGALRLYRRQVVFADSGAAADGARSSLRLRLAHRESGGAGPTFHRPEYQSRKHVPTPQPLQRPHLLRRRCRHGHHPRTFQQYDEIGKNSRQEEQTDRRNQGKIGQTHALQNRPKGRPERMVPRLERPRHTPPPPVAPHRALSRPSYHTCPYTGAGRGLPPNPDTEGR